MAEQVAAKKKREPKPGTSRVTVNLTEEEYTFLAKSAEEDMREPNNLLSFALRGKIKALLQTN